MKRHNAGKIGGAGAKHTPRLVLVSTVGMFALSGCGRVLPGVPSHSVQIDALVPLHPAYSQMLMQTEIAGTVVREAGSAALPQPHQSPSLPPAFAMGDLVPPSLAEEREKRVALDSRRYLALLEDSLTRRNTEIIEREDRAGHKQTTVEIEAERAKREQAMREQFAKERADIEREKSRLEFRQVGFESLARVYTGRTREDARLQLGAVGRQIAMLDKRLLDKDDKTVPALVAAGLKDFIQERETDLTRRLQNRRKRLEGEVEDRLSREKLRLAAESEGIPELREAVMPASLPSDRPLPPITSSPATAFAQTKPRLAAAIAQAQAEQTPERTRLLSVLRADTQKAVEQIALREGWKVVPVGTPGATDYTPHTADALRDQWK